MRMSVVGRRVAWNSEPGAIRQPASSSSRRIRRRFSEGVAAGALRRRSIQVP